jgi:peptidyl-tRNA hydrolase, PTH1 family
MKLIVGLGNPGNEYAKTRHNAGFMVLDALSGKYSAEWCDNSRFKAATAELHEGGEIVILMKPLTFMNVSGEAVSKMAEYYKIEPKDIWVVSDDVDLPLGTVRVRDDCESGGHNGLKSIDQALGTQAYWHIRLGIAPVVPTIDSDKDLHDRLDTAVYVLQQFENREWSLVDQAVNLAVGVIAQAVASKNPTSHTHRIALDGHIES